MRRCVPGTHSLTGCSQPLHFQPALTGGCQPSKLGLSAALPLLLPSAFSQVPQVSPSSHLKRPRPLCFPRQSGVSPRAHLQSHQSPYRLQIARGPLAQGTQPEPRASQQEGGQPILGPKKQQHFSTSIYKHN